MTCCKELEKVPGDQSQAESEEGCGVLMQAGCVLRFRLIVRVVRVSLIDRAGRICAASGSAGCVAFCSSRSQSCLIRAKSLAAFDIIW